MAPSIPSILGRKLLPATVIGGGVSHLFDDKKSMVKVFSPSVMPPQSPASCEAPPAPRWDGEINNNPFLAPRLRETVLRKRMTSVGRFSLKSETEDNRSIPTFFLALSGEKKEEDGNSKDAPDTAMHKFPPRRIFTVSDFEDAWLKRGMPSRHPRFHSTVCPQQQYFEETHHVHPPTLSTGEDGAGGKLSLQIKAEIDRHASETMHFPLYREDLCNRLEHMLTSPLVVSEKMWEVKISNGLLGSSGAISRVKADSIRKTNLVYSLPPQCPPPQKFNGHILRRNTTKGGLWGDATQEVEKIPMETVLLFRSHHALADGASAMAALSDLSDEAEEIRAKVKMEMEKWKRGGGSKKNALQRILTQLARLLNICLWLSLGTFGALVYQGYLQMTTPRNPFDAVREDAERKGLTLSGRSISWCDAASLAEVKRIAEIIGKSKGVAITMNDLFVSCVTSAVTRQLIEHQEFMAPIDAHKRNFVPQNINVVIPVHLRGGVILPNETVGNNIGAFVARCPGEMKYNAVGGGTTSCPAERICQVHKSLLYLKRSPAPFVSHYMAKFCSDYLPEEWTKSIFQSANANACVVVSNTRGYDKKLHIQGMVVESAAGFLPLPPGIPIGIVVQSYAGTVSLSVTAEKWAVPDADNFLRFVLDEYRRLYEETSNLEKKQKIMN